MIAQDCSFLTPKVAAPPMEVRNAGGVV